MKKTLLEKLLPASMEARRARQGFVFTIPWVLGFLVFFFYPAIQSIWYSLANTNPLDEHNGTLIEYFTTRFAGMDHYKHMWTIDTSFTTNLFDSIVDFFYSLPIILFLSFVFAIVLNQNFRGRMIVRAIFFLPVIIASGVVLTYLNGDTTAQELLESGSGGGLYNSFSFSTMLENVGLPNSLVKQLNEYIASIFNLVWSSGVQTILFLAGLQSISAQYYEVAKVEGATGWETFWYVTVPMMSNVIVLNVVYTCIDLFTSNSNKVMKQAYTLIEGSEYNKSAAIMWSYFLILGVILGAILIIFRKPLKRAAM